MSSQESGQELEKEKPPQVAFSVKYTDLVYPTKIWAADWDCWPHRQWARSWARCHPFGHWMNWHPVAGLDIMAYEAILKKFGLMEWPGEFPLEKIITMSPAELIAERRKKEKERKSRPRRVVSDNICWDITGHKSFSAEKYP